MSKPAKPRGEDGASLPKLTADRNNDGKVDIREAIDRMKEVNSQTDVLRDDITKTGKDIAQIAKAFKEYLQTRKKDPTNKDDDATPTSKTNKICKVYGCIYKGTYDGIIDGLKQVEEDKQKAKLEKDRVDAQKQFIKSTAKNIIGFPNAFRKGLINLFAFENSEILQTYRAIRHSVGIDKNGKVDYAQRAFRLMLEDKSNKNKDVSVQGIGVRQIELLEGIADALGAEGKVVDRKARRDTETQLDLLRDIRKGVGAQRRTFLQIQGITWRRTMTQSAYQTELLQGINSKLKIQSGGFFGMFKKNETQTDILSDIRTSLAPAKEKPGFWTKPRYIFKRDTQRIDIGQRTIESLQGVISELKFQTEGMEAVYNAVNGGMTVQLAPSNALTTYEFESLKNLENIDEANVASVDAITELPKNLCGCMLKSARADDYNSQKLLENSIGADERERENMANVISIRDSAAGIYDIMVKKANGPDIQMGQQSFISSAKDMISTAGDISEVVQGTKSIKDMFTGKSREVVSLSSSTMRKFESIFDGGSDGYDNSGGKKKKNKKNKGSKSKFPSRKKSKLPKSKGGLFKRGKNALSKGKGGLKNAATKGKGLLGGAKGLALKGGSLIASTVPTMTGGLGMGGLLSSSAGGIASAGAGAAAGAAGLVTAAGAAGYGVGTLINKGIDAGMEKATGGKSKSLGGWIYNITHKKELEAQRIQHEKLMKDIAKGEAKKTTSLKAESAKLSAVVVKGNVTAGAKIANMVAGASAIMAAGDNVRVAAVDKIKKIGSGVNMDAVLGAGASTATLARGIAGEIISTAQGIEVSRTLTAIYDKSESARIHLLTEMKDAIDTAKAVTNGSQTAQAIGETFSDIKNVVTGATTNITMAVSPHDTDRNTNLMNDAYGA